MIQCEKLALIYFALFLKYYFIVFSHAIRKLLVAALNPYKYVSYKCVCTCVCLIAHSYLTLWPHGLPGSSVRGDSPGKNTGAGCHAFLQGIFPTQGPNPCLLHCKQILYSLNHQGSPSYICLRCSFIFCNKRSQNIIGLNKTELYLSFI